MQISKFISDECINKSSDPASLQGRCTGETTATALGIISDAMLHPGVTLDIVGSADVGSLEDFQGKLLVRAVNRLIETLEFKHLNVSRKHSRSVGSTGYSILYDIYRWVPEPEENTPCKHAKFCPFCK